jgi:hypothetical protein
MSLPGPILVVSDHHDRKLMAGLAGAGAFPVVESKLVDAAVTIGELGPAAIVFADPDLVPSGSVLEALIAAIDAAPAPFVPVVARVKDCGETALDVLPVGAGASVDLVVARLASALRVRTLHATVLRRIDTLRGNGAEVPELPAFDPLDEATMLVVGRGRAYPTLTAAAAARVGLIGTLSVENAARYLNTRDVDGLIIGDGFGPSTIEAFLTALASDSRFRELPIGLTAEMPAGPERLRLANLEPVSGTPADIVSHLLPLVRVHAFSTRLRRHVAALDSRGATDAQTGLCTISAFARDLPRVVADHKARRAPMSIARFAFSPDLGWRLRTDAARLTLRLLRPNDFGCQTEDGSMVVVFADSPPRNAHVFARKIASMMRQAKLDRETGDAGQGGIDPMVTLAFLKITDTAESLLERVSDPEPVAVAAE